MGREVQFKTTTCTGCGKEIRRRSIHKQRWCSDCRKSSRSKGAEVPRGKTDSAMRIDITNQEEVTKAYDALTERRKTLHADMEELAKELDQISVLQQGLSLLLGDDRPATDAGWVEGPTTTDKDDA